MSRRLPLWKVNEHSFASVMAALVGGTTSEAPTQPFVDLRLATNGRIKRYNQSGNLFFFPVFLFSLPTRSVSSQPRNAFIGKWKQMDRGTAVSLLNFKAWPCHARKWKSKVHFQVRPNGRQGRVFERVWNTMKVLESLVNRTYLEMYICRREICWTYGGCNFV